MVLPYDTVEPEPFFSAPTPEERLIERAADALCTSQGMSYRAMMPIQRLFLTHYRCSFCKLLPLYYLDMSSHRKARCGKCGHLISFSGSGKYGKMRKKLALTIWQVRGGEKVPFNSSIEAFMYAMREGVYAEHAVEVIYRIGYVRNGLKRCSVQVMHGYTGYSIDAYGEEADELCRVAKKYSSKEIAVVSQPAIL